MELSMRELNELIYCIDVARKHGQLLGTTVADVLAVKLRDELDRRLAIDAEIEDWVIEVSNQSSHFVSDESDELKSVLKSILGDANPLVDTIHSHFVSNEEADEDYRSALVQDEHRYKKSRVNKGVTQSILDYVEFMGEATYTEMQNYYRSKFGSNSFSHILISLVVPYKNRPTRRYLYKTASGKYVVRVAGLHNWVEKDY
jgi:hypothetical protein